LFEHSWHGTSNDHLLDLLTGRFGILLQEQRRNTSDVWARH
jgi:hypothetical protein